MRRSDAAAATSGDRGRDFSRRCQKRKRVTDPRSILPAGSHIHRQDKYRQDEATTAEHPTRPPGYGLDRQIFVKETRSNSCPKKNKAPDSTHPRRVRIRRRARIPPRYRRAPSWRRKRWIRKGCRRTHRSLGEEKTLIDDDSLDDRGRERSRNRWDTKSPSCHLLAAAPPRPLGRWR